MAHWYLPDGQPFYEVPAKTRGGMRSAHIGDARKAGAYPSVTTIIGVSAKPALENWKRRQDIMAALTYPDITRLLAEQTAEEVIKRIQADAMAEAKQAAAAGTAVHDAIEAHFLGKYIPPEYHATVNAVLALLEEHCGQQNWEAEKWFAHPLGFGGKIDLISDGWVIDFKTKPGRAEDHKMYKEQLQQLVAYDVGTGPEIQPDHPGYRKKANIIVSRDIPGSVQWWPWDAEHLAMVKTTERDEWRKFRCLLEWWQIENNHFPHLEIAA